MCVDFLGQAGHPEALLGRSVTHANHARYQALCLDNSPAADLVCPCQFSSKICFTFHRFSQNIWVSDASGHDALRNSGKSILKQTRIMSLGSSAWVMPLLSIYSAVAVEVWPVLSSHSAPTPQQLHLLVAQPVMIWLLLWWKGLFQFPKGLK